MPDLVSKEISVPKNAPGGDTRTLAEAIAVVRRKFNPVTMQYIGEEGNSYKFKIRATR